MIDDLEIDRLQFIKACAAIQGAYKNREGTHWIHFNFSPGELKIECPWATSTLSTTGSQSARGKIALAHVRKMIRDQNLKKLKKEKLACRLAPGYGKFVVEDAFIKLKFE